MGAIVALIASVMVIVAIMVLVIFISVARRRSGDSLFELLHTGQLVMSADHS
jgi:hypothetical protein